MTALEYLNSEDTPNSDKPASAMDYLNAEEPPKAIPTWRGVAAAHMLQSPSLSDDVSKLETGVETGLTGLANKGISAYNILKRSSPEMQRMTGSTNDVAPLTPGQSLLPENAWRAVKNVVPQLLDAVTGSGKSNPQAVDREMDALAEMGAAPDEASVKAGIPDTAAAKGITDAAVNVGKGFTTLSGLATLPLFEFKAGRAALLGLQALHTPGEVKKAYGVLSDDKATPQQKWAAGGEAFANLAMTGALALGVTEESFKSTHTPEEAAKIITGKDLNMPEGAQPPKESIPATESQVAPATVEEAPNNPGGAQEDLLPEVQAESKANNAPTAGWGDTAQALMKQIDDEKAAESAKVDEPSPVEQPKTPAKPIVDQPVNKTETHPQRYKIGKSPQTHVEVDRPVATTLEKSLGEQPVTIKNEKTGEIQVVRQSDLTEVKTPASKAAQPKENLDDQLRAAKLDPSVFKTIAQKKDALKRQLAKEATMLGPGAAGATGEIEEGQAPGTANQATTGPSSRVLEKRRLEGSAAPIESGQGISPAESVERGRDLLNKGTNPETVMQNFEKTGRFNAEDLSVARAHEERLYSDLIHAWRTYGRNSDQFEAAFDRNEAWQRRAKRMSTEWHAKGQAQQGEVNIDTGTFVGLRKAFREATDYDKDFTPKQAKQADDIAKGVEKVQKDAVDASKKLNENLAQSSSIKDTPQTEDSKAVWKQVKSHIDKGDEDFDTIRNNVATELGMPVSKVTKILSENKTTRRLADDAWRKQQTARRMKQQAKIWVNAQAQPWILQLPKAILREAFNLKVLGHVSVGLGTHAPMVFFQPKYWGEYFKNYGNMWKMGLPTERAKAVHEMMMQDLQRRPNWTTARRGGLENDPFSYNEYQLSGLIEKLLPNLVHGGNRAYDALKLLRQDMFDRQWNKLPDSLQSPEMASSISDSVNHVTGIVKKSPFGKVSGALFAPRLLASRFAWAFGDPARAAITGAKTLSDIVRKGDTATEAEKSFAINQVREKGTVIATMGAMLAANAAILALSNSKQKVNFTDPTRSDWLKFKAAGMDISYGNAMLTTLRLPVREAAILWHNTIFASQSSHRFEAADRATADAIFEYIRNQLNPALGDIADIGFQNDAQGRPLPWNKQQVPPAYLRRRGVAKAYTWPEWVRDTTMPISLEEPVKQIFNDYGMPKDQAEKWTKIIGTAIFMGGTGGRISEDGYKDSHK